jgi:hypothetical protein
LDGFLSQNKGNVEDCDEGETGSRLLAAGMHHVFFLCTRLEKKENVLVLVLCDLLRDHMVMNDSTIVDGTQRAEAADDVHG